MGTITTVYKSKFKEVLNPYGFKLYRSTFYRVINDVVQTIMLKKTHYNCSIHFTILPLVLEISDLYCEGHDIYELRNGKMRKRPWEFVPSKLGAKNAEGEQEEISFNEGSIESIVDSMLSIVVSHVIPLFEKGVDCKSAIEEINKYGIAVYGEELAESYDHGRYWWYIKIGDYKKAIECLQKSIKRIRFNPYEKIWQLKLKNETLVNLKLENERTFSAAQQVNLNLLSCNKTNEKVKEQFLNHIEHTKKSNVKLIVLQQRILELEHEIEQLKDPNSLLSKELKDQEVEYEGRIRKAVEPLQKLIDLLSIPDIEYFKKVIEEKEAKSLEYLKAPSKYKRHC